ncbi:MAG: sce7726 family protein [Rhodocyclaceae bacterium]|nr:sce7726 family protein [Rhodocyclaceae bacterium]
MLSTPPAAAVSAPIEEHEIRAALLARLRMEWHRDAMVLEEFRIERGSSRIDVAVIDEELVGYEIKSDKDSFARFSNQIHAYNRVFDRICLVCGPALEESARSVIPSWWGVIVAKRDTVGAVSLEIHRDAGVNLRQDAFSLASLLWREEALAALGSLETCTPAPKRVSAHVLWDSMAKNLPVDAIRAVVAESLLKRQA